MDPLDTAVAPTMGPSVSLEEYFTYHPVSTPEREAAHKSINDAALQFARVLDSLSLDPKLKEMSFFAIQQARMFANQGAVISELRKNELSGDG